jgi:hypothetical protein
MKFFFTSLLYSSFLSSNPLVLVTCLYILGALILEGSVISGSILISFLQKLLESKVPLAQLRLIIICQTSIIY